jgi:hypothetical protein
VNPAAGGGGPMSRKCRVSNGLRVSAFCR